MSSILTNYNKPFNLSTVPEVLEDDLRYCVLDYSKPDDADFIFPPLIFLDQFTRPSVDLRVGKYRVQVPMDWAIVIADKNSGAMEIIELKHLNDRTFQAFCFNPICGYMPSFYDIEIENIFPDVTWAMPNLITGHILAIPLEEKDEPLCAFFARDIQRINEIDISKIFG